MKLSLKFVFEILTQSTTKQSLETETWMKKMLIKASEKQNCVKKKEINERDVGILNKDSVHTEKR